MSGLLWRMLELLLGADLLWAASSRYRANVLARAIDDAVRRVAAEQGRTETDVRERVMEDFGALGRCRANPWDPGVPDWIRALARHLQKETDDERR